MTRASGCCSGILTVVWQMAGKYQNGLKTVLSKDSLTLIHFTGIKE